MAGYGLFRDQIAAHRNRELLTEEVRSEKEDLNKKEDLSEKEDLKIKKRAETDEMHREHEKYKHAIPGDRYLGGDPNLSHNKLPLSEINWHKKK